MKYPEQYRISGSTEDDGGAFHVRFNGEKLYVIASHGGGWDHVSVSKKNRCPNWKEMCFIKKLFFGDDALAIQYHPPKINYKNLHPYCLHLWRPQDDHIQLPPPEFV